MGAVAGWMEPWGLQDMTGRARPLNALKVHDWHFMAVNGCNWLWMDTTGCEVLDNPIFRSQYPIGLFMNSNLGRPS